jgi:hypothetical protein
MSPNNCTDGHLSKRASSSAISPLLTSSSVLMEENILLHQLFAIAQLFEFDTTEESLSEKVCFTIDSTCIGTT